MKKIAIIQFPGLNSEIETKRAVDDAGMEGVLFRWNATSATCADGAELRLENFDGYIVPGGFSYEDRGRAGLISSLDPVMEKIRPEVGKGKPLLGICNGAQVVVETCLVPGSGKLELCLANNKRVKDGEILGTGFINFDVPLIATAAKGRCAFNLTIDKDSLHSAPIAHGEGRFTSTDVQTIVELQKNDQIVFTYCDEDGKIDAEYPINPNGALMSAAGICNLAGNVMAIMPHPERAYGAPIPEIFESMRIYLEEYFDQGKAMVPETIERVESNYSLDSLKNYTEGPAMYGSDPYFEIHVDLIITDNTAETFANTLNLMGFPVNIERQVHYVVQYDANSDPMQMAVELIKSGELLNTNKEVATVRIDGKTFKFSPDSESLQEASEASHEGYEFYVKDLEDFEGQSKSAKISKHLSVPGFKNVIQGTKWTVTGSESVDIDRILKTNIFANPNSQELYTY